MGGEMNSTEGRDPALDPSLAEEPLTNAIYLGIKQDIDTLLRANGYRGALILTYAAIDCMASLAMPDGRTEVRRQDFVEWAQKYIRFPGKHQLTGMELYGARCALLHQYGTESRSSREGKCRV